jgi:membrane-associated phospholipid phosphatase
VHTVTVWAAQYLLYAMVVVLAAVWLFAENRRGKVELGVAAVLGLVLALIFMYVAKHAHSDPRPFVDNPSIKPFFGHSRDDGFPSDHAVAAGLIAGLALWRHRLIGVVLLLAAIVVAWARVAAHVHHLQDVVAGLLLGGLAAAIAAITVILVGQRASWRTAAPNTQGAADANGTIFRRNAGR